MKKSLTLVMVLAMVLTLLGGCGSKDTGKIFLGGTAPLTGGAAIYGIAAKRGAEIAVEEINAKGGLQFDLHYEDDAHDAEQAKNAFNKLLDDGMQLSLGTVTSAPCEATAAIAKDEKIFCLTPSASSTAVTKAGQGYEFQLCFSDPNQGAASAEYISSQKLAAKVAIIYQNDDVYSTGIYESFKQKADEKGLEIVSATTFTKDSATDFSVQVKAAKDAGADLIFLPMYYTPASQIIIECKNTNYAPKFFGVDGMDGILTLPGFDTSLAEGVMLLTPFNADAADEKTQNFVKKYQELYNEVPNQFAADAYDCVYALYEACTQAKITSNMKAADITEKLLELFNGGFTFSGLTGENMKWNANGEVEKAPKGMKIQNGAYVGM